MPITSSLFDAWSGYVARRRRHREYRQTINAVSDLPKHVLKDIGWPGAYEHQRRRRR